MVLHNGIWFNEVEHQLGLEEALVIEEQVANVLVPIITKRIMGVFDTGTKAEGLRSFEDMPSARLIELIDALSLSWLASDGVWFQAVKNTHDM